VVGVYCQHPSGEPLLQPAIGHVWDPARHRIGHCATGTTHASRADKYVARGLGQSAGSGPMPTCVVSRGLPAPHTVASLRKQAHRRRPPRLLLGTVAVA